MDPYKRYLLLCLETKTSAQRRRVDTRERKHATAFALLRRQLARLLRSTDDKLTTAG
jgi:hypothetical protein